MAQTEEQARKELLARQAREREEFQQKQQQKGR